MNEYTCLDLFTGLGAWAIAFESLGVRTLAFCEIDERCQRFLAKAWPGIPIHADIRKLNGTQFRGVDILQAGCPCQPASRAGDQRGAADDRWLWGEVIRVVEEAQPRVCIFENPPGIEDVGLDGILLELEGKGYEIAPIFDIPACAVNSPQLRHRYYIVAISRRERSRQDEQGRGSERRDVDRGNAANNLADGAKSRHEATDTKPGSNGCASECSQGDVADSRRVLGNSGDVSGSEDCSRTGACAEDHELCSGFWDKYVWLPCADNKLRRAPDCALSLAHRVPGELPEALGQTPKECQNMIVAHRSLLGALGNAQVPAVALEIARAVLNQLNSL